MKDLIQKIVDIDVSKINLYFFTKARGKVDSILSHVSVDDKMKNNLYYLVEETLMNKKVEDKELIEFCPITSRKDTIEYGELGLFDDLREYVEMIIENQEVFSGVEENNEDFYCIQLITNDDENIFCFNKVDTLQSLRKKWLGIFSNTFREYQIPNDIISLGSGISTIVMGNDVYIFNKSVLRQIINIDKMIEERASRNLEEIKLQGIIENYDTFENDVLKHKRSLNISAKASQRNVVSKVAVEKVKMKNAADRLFNAGKISSKINFNLDTQNIVYSEGQERDILILLNDLGYETLILNEMNVNE